MEMMEKKTVTGTEAFLYVREQLGIGSTLSQCVNGLSVEEGKIFAFVANATPHELVYRFNSGGIYAPGKSVLNDRKVIPIQNDARPLVVNEISEYLKISNENCCLFEDINGDLSYPWVKASGIEYVHLNEKEVFYFFSSENNFIEKINKALVRSENYNFLCAISSLGVDDRRRFQAFHAIDIGLINLFVKNIFTFFVRAYDGEGYLQWRK